MTPKELHQLDLRMAALCGMVLKERTIPGWPEPEVEHYWLCPDGRELRSTDWRPTQNVVQAFQIAEMVCENSKNVFFYLKNFNFGRRNRWWSADFFNIETEEMWDASSETKELAICLAADKALQASKED